MSLGQYDFRDVEWLLGPIRVASIIVAPLIAVPVLAFFAAVFWVMSLILGGRGSYCGLFTGLAFASVPTESAVGFYLRQGFQLTDEPDPELLALEPEDIHMVKQL